MKWKAVYEPRPEDREALRRQALKGVGAGVCLLALIALAGGVTRAQTGTTVALAIDFVGIVSLLIVIRAYSAGHAALRVALAREAAKQKRWADVAGLLGPFAQSGVLNRRSRFDPSGEAHYLLAKACAELGEEEVFAYCRAFLGKFRPGEWAKKAVGLKMRPEG